MRREERRAELQKELATQEGKEGRLSREVRQLRLERQQAEALHAAQLDTLRRTVFVTMKDPGAASHAEVANRLAEFGPLVSETRGPNWGRGLLVRMPTAAQRRVEFRSAQDMQAALAASAKRSITLDQGPTDDNGVEPLLLTLKAAQLKPTAGVLAADGRTNDKETALAKTTERIAAAKSGLQAVEEEERADTAEVGLTMLHFTSTCVAIHL